MVFKIGYAVIEAKIKKDRAWRKRRKNMNKNNNNFMKQVWKKDNNNFIFNEIVVKLKSDNKKLYLVLF